MSLGSLSSLDGVSTVLEHALDGLALRQRTIADNLANLDTPHFRASYVDFESSLQASLRDGAASGGALDLAAPVVGAADTPVGANDNNVDLRKETLAAMQSQFQYQLLARAVTDRYDLVRTIAGAA